MAISTSMRISGRCVQGVWLHGYVTGLNFLMHGICVDIAVFNAQELSSIAFVKLRMLQWLPPQGISSYLDTTSIKLWRSWENGILKSESKLHWKERARLAIRSSRPIKLRSPLHDASRSWEEPLNYRPSAYMEPPSSALCSWSHPCCG